MKYSFQTGLLFFLCVAATFAQNTVLVMDSEPGDYIGGGDNYYYTPAEGAFFASQNYDNGVSIGFANGSHDWSLNFAAPDSALLKVQVYDNAVRFPFQGSGEAGLDVSGDGRGCNTLTGEFEVKQIVYGSDGAITSFHATFVQHCEGFGPALTGEVLYYSSDPLPPVNHITSALSAYGTRNHLFEYYIRASNDPTSFTATNLPAGLSLDASSGLVSGVPSVQGTFSIPISAIGIGGTASATLALIIDPPGQSTGPYTALFMESDPGDFIGQGDTYYYKPVDGNFTASQYNLNFAYLTFTTPDYSHFWYLNFSAASESTLGLGAYFGATRFSSSANPGLDISGDGRGCNESFGSFEVKELGFTNDRLTVFRTTFEQHCEDGVPALRGESWFNSMNAVTSDPFVVAMRDQPFSFQIIGNNQPTSYGAVALPPNLVVDTGTGVISGTPSVGGIFSVPVTAIGPSLTAADRLLITIEPPAGDNAPVVTSVRKATGTIQQAFSYQVTATGSPTQFSASGLPAGIALDANTGLIAGIPTGTGNFNVILTATNGSGTGGISLTLSIYPPIPVVTSANHASALTETPFGFQVTASNQPTGYSTSGLPPGLTIDSTTGFISGIAASTGTFLVTVRAGNGTGVGFQTFTLTVDLAPPKITSALVADGVEGGFFYYQITATGSPTSFAATGLPPGLTITDYYGGISGIPTGAGPFNITISATNAAGTGSATLVLTLAARSSQLLNLSTRLAVGADDEVLIGGFIVTGSGSKTVLIRGIGPTLSNFGVAGALSDPMLELHDASGNILATNDNWRDSQEAQIQGTQIPPSDDLESAILFSLSGDGTGYTAILRGKDGGTGVGLVEVYDLDSAADSLVANISTRGVVGMDDDVMVGGFIIGGGSADGTIIVRAIGPSLTSFGVSGALSDPTLEIHDGSGNTIATNDDWKEAQQVQIEATGLSPTDDREAAILATLPVGGYTAIIRGKAGATGVALVEVYRLP